MQNVPKIVRDRLRQPGSLAAETHPDADLLTAFAEHSLAAPERKHVLRHLAQCGDCREIVHLALPDTEDAAPNAFGRRTQAGWLRWQALRWGVVAAGILAVTSIGVFQFSHRQDKALVATRFIPRDQLAPAEPSAPISLATSASPTAVASPPPGQAEKHAEVRKKVASAQALSGDKAATANAVFARSNQFHGGVAGGKVAGSSAGATFGGPVHRDTPPNRAFASVPAGRSSDSAASAKQSSRIPSASEAVEVSGAAPAGETETAAQNGTQDQLVQKQAAVKLQSSGEQSEAIVRAKPTPPQDSPGMAAPGLQKDAALRNSPAPRWTISANGALQRSLDGGMTWLDVNLATDSLMSSNLVGQSQSELMVAKNSRARSETKADAKSAAVAAPAPPMPAVFRALSVSSNADEVWAGGSAGVLYHTMDGGNLWVRVVPSDTGIVLTGDIVSIQFSDPRNGTVTTSSAAAWTTNDDGQTWHKQ